MTITPPHDDPSPLLDDPRDAGPDRRPDAGPDAALDSREAADSVVEKLWDLQHARPPRGTVARLLGRSPLAPEAKSWFSGALGEIEVAERLRALSVSGESWRVLHSVPVGRGTADIDHVVIGPAGVFTLNTKNHPGKRIWVAGSSVLVDGHKTFYARNSRHEAGRAARLLSAALGRPVDVRSLVVVVGSSSLTVKRQPDDVAVLTLAQLIRYLRRQTPVLSVDEVRELTRAALRPGTWQRRPARPGTDAGSPARPTAHELHTWFSRVRSEVQRARRARGLWLTGLAVGLAGGITAVVAAGIPAWQALAQGIPGRY